MADLAAFFAKKASKKKKKGVINLQEIGEQLERRAMEQRDEMEDAENNPMDEASGRGSRQSNSNEGVNNEDSEWLDFNDKPNIPISIKEIADLDIEDDDEDKRSSAEPTRTWNINSNKVGPAPPTAFVKKKFKGLKPKLDIMDEKMFPSIGQVDKRTLKKAEEETRQQEIREKWEREQREEEKRRHQEIQFWEKRERGKKERQRIKNMYKRLMGRSYADGMTGNFREEGLWRGEEGGMHNPPMDNFEMFFGGGGGFSRGEKPSKVRDTVHQMTVSLDKMYNGCTKRLRVQRNIQCPVCGGIGGGKQQCKACHGRGANIRRKDMRSGRVRMPAWKKYGADLNLLVEKDGDDQVYAQVLKMLGGGRVSCLCADGKTRLGRVRGSMYGRVWVNVGDFVLLSLRTFGSNATDDNKADVLVKYTRDEVRMLREAGKLPQMDAAVGDGEVKFVAEAALADSIAKLALDDESGAAGTSSTNSNLKKAVTFTVPVEGDNETEDETEEEDDSEETEEDEKWEMKKLKEDKKD